MLSRLRDIATPHPLREGGFRRSQIVEQNPSAPPDSVTTCFALVESLIKGSIQMHVCVVRTGRVVKMRRIGPRSDSAACSERAGATSESIMV